MGNIRGSDWFCEPVGLAPYTQQGADGSRPGRWTSSGVLASLVVAAAIRRSPLLVGWGADRTPTHLRWLAIRVGAQAGPASPDCATRRALPRLTNRPRQRAAH